MVRGLGNAPGSDLQAGASWQHDVHGADVRAATLFVFVTFTSNRFAAREFLPSILPISRSPFIGSRACFSQRAFMRVSVSSILFSESLSNTIFLFRPFTAAAQNEAFR